MKDPTPNERLTKARVQLLLDHPFFGTLATKLENVMDPAVKTTATNGTNIRWNPEYLAGLTPGEIRAVIAHDVLHVANGHTWRRGARDGETWNRAADKAINHILKEAGLTLPKGEEMPGPGEAGKAAEAIYNMMGGGPPQEQKQGGGPGQGKKDPKGQPAPGNGPQNAKDGKPGKPGQNGTPGQPGTQPGQQPGKGPGNDAPGCGKVEDAPPDQAGDQAGEWKVAVAQAVAAAGRGDLPGNLLRMVDEIVNPRVAWEVLLRDFIERTARNDYNWAVPNRRYIQQGIVLPSLVSEELPEIVLVVDTSGSIGATQLAAFAAEASGVLAAYETTIHIVWADARVNGTRVVTRADFPLQLEHKGGGGTDFKPAFAWVAKQGLAPACLIYLTDLDGPFPAQEPDYPVLWIATTDDKAPWGETVRLTSTPTPFSTLPGGGGT